MFAKKCGWGHVRFIDVHASSLAIARAIACYSLPSLASFSGGGGGPFIARVDQILLP